MFLARPLLAFKRDLSRPTSEIRVPTEQDTLSTPRTPQESSSSSSPLEIIDIDASGSFKSIFDKVKNTLSPSVKRRTSEQPHVDETKNSSKENYTSSINASANKKSQIQPNKTVSFANNIEHDYDSDSNNQYSINNRNEIIRNAQTLADQILIASIDQATTKSIDTSANNDEEDNFQRDFHLTIKPRRITSNNKEELVYQDLSAEIVAYVLKHAIRTLKKEQEQLLIGNTNEQNDEDFIDLK